jgi:VCBS repeat-containing protein
MTRGQVLSTVDFVALQLLGSPIIQPGRKDFVIRIFPFDSEGVLSIASVTQGTYGTVTTNKNGTLTYKPDSNEPKADSFVVTVQDTEGDTISETVSIVSPCNGDTTVGRWANRFEVKR